MCGLAGIILKHKDRGQTEKSALTNGFSQMLRSANTRGGHATGFAIVDNYGNYNIHKANVDAYSFLSNFRTQSVLNSIRQDDVLLMGHTRYATQGSPSVNKNNHPIRAGHTIGTHNGWVSNDRELFNKFDLERFAQVDSEVIFRMYDDSKDVRDFVDNRLSLIKGKLAIVWTDLERPEYVYIIKANNPFEMCYIPELEALAYGSTETIINSGFRSNVKPIDIKPNTMLRINTNTLKMRKTNIAIDETPKRKSSYFNTCTVNYNKTIPNFVPRFSWKEQGSLFKNINASDGSKIKVKK